MIFPYLTFPATKSQASVLSKLVAGLYEALHVVNRSLESSHVCCWTPVLFLLINDTKRRSHRGYLQQSNIEGTCSSLTFISLSHSFCLQNNTITSNFPAPDRVVNLVPYSIISSCKNQNYIDTRPQELQGNIMMG